MQRLAKYLFAVIAALAVFMIAKYDPALAQEAAPAAPTPPPSPINTGDTA